MSPLTLEKIRKMFALSLKGTFMQIEKALINDCVQVSKVSLKVTN